MATQTFYLSNVGAETDPTITSWWDDSVSDGASALTFAPAGDNVGHTRTGTTGGDDVLLQRWVSPEITTAGTLEASGEVADFLAAVASDGSSTETSWGIHVITSDGSTRGTFLPATAGGDPWAGELTGKLENTPAGFATPVDVEPGDRVVIEFGFRPASGGVTGEVRAGGTDATDLAAGDTGTAATTRPGSVTFTGADSSDLWEGATDPGEQLELTGSDGGQLTESATASVTLAGTDAGALGDVRANPVAELARSDTGQLGEDTASWAALQRDDTGRLGQQASTARPLAGTDSGALGESAGTARPLTRADAAELAERHTAAVAATSEDGGQLAEASVRDSTNRRTGTDAADLAELAELTTRTARIDTAELAERAAPSVTLQLADTAELAELAVIDTTTPRRGTDTAELGELARLTVLVTPADTAELAERAAPSATLQLADAGHLAELGETDDPSRLYVWPPRAAAAAVTVVAGAASPLVERVGRARVTVD